MAADPTGPPRLRRGDQAVHQFFDLSSFAEQLLVHENHLVKIRDDMPLDKAALIGCGVTHRRRRGDRTPRRSSRARPSRSSAAAASGSTRSRPPRSSAPGAIIAVDRVPSKLQLAEDFGATDIVQRVRGRTRSSRCSSSPAAACDHAFEAIGLKATAEQAFNMLAKGGTADDHRHDPAGRDRRADAASSSCSRRRSRARTWDRTGSASTCRSTSSGTSRGRLKLDELVSAVITLDEINDGFAALKTGEVARTIIAFD